MGVESEHFYQKRAPQSRPRWIEVATIRFPSGRTAEEVVPRDAAALAWLANLACLELHPHPVRAEDLDQPDEFTLASMPARFHELGDLHEGIDRHAGSIQSLLELFERQGEGDAPWPPYYRKAPPDSGASRSH